MSRRPAVFTVAAALAAIALLQVPLPFLQGTQLGQVVENAAHAPLFAVLAALAWWALPWSRARYGLAWVASVVLGGVTELIQLQTGRDASWLDLGTDALGATAALALIAAWRAEGWGRHRAGRFGLLAFTAVAVLMVAMPVLTVALAYWQRAQQVPVLWQYRSPLDRVLLSRRTDAFAINPASRCIGVYWQPNADDKLALDEPWPDWRGYRELLVTIENRGDAPQALSLRVHDRAHNNQYGDRYDTTLSLPPKRTSVLRLALADIERAPRTRAMDLGQIAGIILFPAVRDRPTAFCLVSISLTR